MDVFEEKRKKIFSTRSVKQILNDINLDRENWCFEDGFNETLEDSLGKIGSQQ